MKLTTVILIASIMQVSASGFAQKLTLNASKLPIQIVFDEIGRQTGYDFLYDSQLLKNIGTISIKVSNADLEATLEQILKGKNLTFSIKEKTVIITARKRTFFDNLIERIQAIDIRGRVVNKEGIPLSGATVKVKDKNLSAVTGADGNFILRSAGEADVLIISYIGYVTKQIGAREGLENIVMEPSDSKLDEIQVIAYGTTTKRLNTGSVGSVKAETIEKQPVGNVLNALVARIPGLDITQQSGVPGSNVTVRIRGTNSLTATANDPFYLIDGVPFLSNAKNFVSNNFRQQPGGGASPFNTLNPTDIESIEVLKDADATAIYGSRGANGVILITTKRAKAGKTKLDVNVSSGFGEVARMMDVLDRRQYLDMRYEALRNDGVNLATATTNVYDLKDWDTTRTTNWQEKLIGGTAQYTNAQLGLSGGNANTSFGLSGGYWKETTVYPGDFADAKGSARFNLNHTSPNNRLKVQFSTNLLKENSNVPQDDLVNAATTLPPVAPELYTADGKLNWAGTTFTNPLSTLYRTYEGRTTNLNANSLMSYQILTGLELKTTLGYTNFRFETLNISPEKAINPINFTGPASRISEFGDHTTQTWNIEPQLNYNTTIASNKLSLLLGGTFQSTLQNGGLDFATGFVDDELMRNKSAAASISTNYSYSQYKYNSIFFRANYVLADRYIINGVARRDGSSRFGPGKAFGNFGSVGAAWIFSQEKLLKSALPFLSFGKLRASYGITGSDAVGNYGYLSLYRASSSYTYYGANGAGILPAGLSNPDYQWETNRKFDVAIELGFFSDRMLLNANYYKNRSGNQLVGYPVSTVTGFATVPFNLPATVQNTGLELELNTINIKKSQFSWTSSFNFTIPRNKLVDYPGLASSSNANTYVIGAPLTITKVVPTAGINPETGTMIYLNRNGQQVSNISGLAVADRTVAVNTGKHFYGGALNAFTYKQWQLDVFVQVAKHTGLIYNMNGIFVPGYIGYNLPQYVYDSRWIGPGSDGTLNKLTQTTTSPAYLARARTTDDAAYDDIFFARLKNVALSYNINPQWLKRVKIDNARIYAQGQNLATFTNYRGMDPENQSASIAPIATMMFGLQLTF